ncbi:hypothetical protein FRB99_007974 [Tulasnella sp. 403]|nr:hypothetical protein FRB99_007974 [Tulasnella sp. 403]
MLDNDLGGDEVDKAGPKDSDVVTSLVPCESSPHQSSAVEDRPEAQTQHETPYLAQAGPDTTPPPGAVQPHPTQPSSPPHNTQAQPIHVSGRYSEQEESRTEPSFTTAPSSVGRRVALKVIQRAKEAFMMFAVTNNLHLLHWAIHLHHVIPLLRDETLLAMLLDLQISYRYQLFELTQNVSLDQSIDAFQLVFGLQAWGVVNCRKMVYGMASGPHYGIRGDLKNLDRGIELLREALEAVVGIADRPPPVVFMLGTLLLKWHKRGGRR